jgi:hypothetical protein
MNGRPVHYELPLPPRSATDGQGVKAPQLYIHAPRGRPGRSIDDSTERFVEATRMGLPADRKSASSPFSRCHSEEAAHFFRGSFRNFLGKEMTGIERAASDIGCPGLP